MAITTVCPSEGAWDKTRILPNTAHFVTYKPTSRILTLYAPDGKKLLEQNIASGVRDFDLFVSQATGEIVVQFADFADGANDWSWKRWWTGVVVPKAASTTPPPATNNAATVAQIRVLLDQIV